MKFSYSSANFANSSIAIGIGTQPFSGPVCKCHAYFRRNRVAVDAEDALEFVMVCIRWEQGSKNGGA
jgi:hypothetical protein